jgi:hypothetical protein
VSHWCYSRDMTENASPALTITHTPADGTLLEGTRKGDGAWEAIKNAGWQCKGWRYFPSIKAIGISHSRDHAPKMALINAAAEVLREAGFTVDIEIDAAPRATADVVADRAARSADRAEALHAKAARLEAESDARLAAADAICERRPFGQPILVGHHSEAGARADQRRIENHMDKFVELRAESRAAELRAKAAEANATTSESPITTANRIERLEAEQRQAQKYLDGYTRRSLMGDGKTVAYEDTYPSATGAYREELLAKVAHLEEQLTHWRAVLDQARAAGRIDTVDWATVAKGDLVKFRGRWLTVARVNAKTVSVETGYSWTDKLPKHEVTGHRAV